MGSLRSRSTGFVSARRRAVPAVVALVAVWVAALLAQPSGLALVESGVLLPVSGMVERPSDVSGGGRMGRPGGGDDRVGLFAFVAVRAQPVSRFEALWASVSGGSFVTLDPDALPGPVAMDVAKQSASAAARRFAGVGAVLVPTVRVLSVGSSSGSRSGTVRDRFVVGDEFVSVAGRRVGSAADVVAFWRSASERSAVVQVRVVVVRAGRVVVLSFTSANLPADVSLVDVFALERSQRFDVVSGDVGGGSGGLMFALGFLDELSPGDLTAGLTVAGTGSVDVDGVVRDVAGVDVKARTAADAGVDVFFFPAATDPGSDGGRVELVPVRSLRDAVTFLCARGATDAACAMLR